MNPQPFRVLLVEDDPDMSEVLAALLAQDGIALESAATVAHAWAKINESTFDLVLLDLGLPDTNGFDLLRRIKHSPHAPLLPVIVVTASAGTPDKLRGFELGAVDYLTKPFESSELRARIRCTLRTKQLQDQLTQANRELTTARIAAETNGRAKAEFLANMSHEIRTPMNGVIAMSSLLMETPLNADQRGYVETIHSSSESLLTIINDILDFSRIESGKMELESVPFDLRGCLDDCLDVLSARAAEKNLDLAAIVEDPIPGQLLGDVTRLRQVLINLVGNGVKFTAQGEVIVNVRAAGSAGDFRTLNSPWHLHFSVQDTGVGIPADRMVRLFKAFSQVDASTTRQFGGTGLGLAISKRLVEMMGGKMWVESVMGKGSSFHFSIPFRAAPAAAKPAPDPRLTQLTGQRVLIVDDNITLCRLLTHRTSKLGLRPRATQHPEQALAWLRDGETFDVVLLDQNMPGLDGPALATEIRKLTHGKNLPLVLLSHLGGQRTTPEIQRANFNGCLNKPLKLAALSEALLRATGSKPANAAAPRTTTSKLDPTLAQRMPLRILVCDDNAINQKVAQRILQQMGYQAEVANHGQEALLAIDRRHFDLVFMDLQMPEMNGIEASHAIRERERQNSQFPNYSPRIIIIAMTASAMVGDRERCLAAGMDDYVSKPVRPEDLRIAVEKWGPKAAGARPGVEIVEPKPITNMQTNTSEVPPVDMDRLMEFSDGTPESLRELVNLYLDQTRKQLDQIREAIQVGNANEVRRVAHSSAGASATCGMTCLAPILRQLEHLGAEGKLETTAALCEQCDREFARITTVLLALLPAQLATQP